MKLKQRFFRKQEIPISRKRSVVLLGNMRDFLTNYEQARQSTQFHLFTIKIETGSTPSKHNLFAHCLKDIRENST